MLFIDRQDKKAATSEYNTIELYPEKTYVDRMRGRTRTEYIWGSKVNSVALVSWLASPDVKQGLEEFFANNAVEVVVKSLIPQAQIRTSDMLFTQADLAKAVRSKVLNPDVASAAVELLCPIFHKLGMMTGYNTYSLVVDYPNIPVTVKMLRAEIDTALVLNSLRKATDTIVSDPKLVDRRVSSKVFAQSICHAHREISNSLLQTHTLGNVMDDIVKGIRVNIDPSGVINNTNGSPNPSWYNSEVVKYFARNVVFIKEALSYSDGYNLTPVSEISQLEHWGSIIKDSINTSDRFQEVLLSDVKNSFYITHLRNIEGKVKSVVVTRAERLTPMSQAIYKTKDETAEGGMFVMGIRDRSTEATTASYPSYNGGLSKFVHQTTCSTILDLIQAGIKVEALIFNPGAVNDYDLETLAMACSSRVYVEANELGFVGTLLSPDSDPIPGASSDSQRSVDVATTNADWEPSFIFRIDDDVPLVMDITSGTHLGTSIMTRDSVEVLLCGHDVSNPIEFEVVEQLLGPQSFNATVMNADDLEVRLVGMNSRLDYKLEVSGLSLQAAIQPINFASLRTSKELFLVSPMYNRSQIENCLDSVVALNDKINSKWKIEASNIGKQDLMSMIQRMLGLNILKLSQTIPRSFRDEFHDTFVNKSIVSLQVPTSEVEVYRVRAMQGPINAAMDCLAFSMFCALLGVKNKSFSRILTGQDLESMSRIYMEGGSDRTKLTSSNVSHLE